MANDAARYTAADLEHIADDRGPFFEGNARQALRWAARVLDAADDAVQAERLRAEAAEKALTSLMAHNVAGKAHPDGVSP